MTVFGRPGRSTFQVWLLRFRMKIRDFKPTDAAILAEIFHDAVHAIGSKDYTQAQTNAWSPAPVSAKKFLDRISDTHTVFVAVDDNDMPLGFIELESNGHIDCFYCHPRFSGTGVGRALYVHLEKAALNAGLMHLYTEASEAALRFFLKVGFTLIRRRDFTHNGVAIHNYLMEKSLH
ncbi:MAG: GNAT family N-acetyltransferase [Pseudomonadota bacterium]